MTITVERRLCSIPVSSADVTPLKYLCEMKKPLTAFRTKKIEKDCRHCGTTFEAANEGVGKL